MEIKIEVPIRMAIFRLAELDNGETAKEKTVKIFIAENCLEQKDLVIWEIENDADRVSLPFHTACGEDVASPAFFP